MTMSKSEPKILLDSDVVRHFINGHQIINLSKIYPKRLVILDKVKAELCRSISLEVRVNNFIMMSKIDILPFPSERAIIVEYANLMKLFGEGESACMAVAKYQKQYIASSNLRDIRVYCEEHSIVYLTTMDILLEGFKKKIFTKIECNHFIKDVKECGSRLPCNTLDEYIALKAKSK